MGREQEWGTEQGALDSALAFARPYRSPEFLSELCGVQGPRHLDEDFVMVQDTFRRFAEERIRPIAEEIHRNNEDIPEEIIEGLSEIGTFGVSIPEEYDGFAAEGEGEYLSMIAATEELSRGSLGVGGSLITRPEILARALLAGGTEEQKKEWLPRMASGELMVAIAVTEPDYGSDVASLRTTATRDGDGWRINGVKTWCTFGARADVYMLLARTDPDRSKGHKGLSLFIVPKERGSGHGFELSQEEGGNMEGRAIDTIGYRGMHSYEVAFENWYVSAENLIGGEEGLGRGFYLQMAGFENGRIQTAARAVGVMQAAYEAAYDYASERNVFGKPIVEFQLTRAKLARMAVIIQASRQFAYRVARLMAQGEGAMEASMVKAYVVPGRGVGDPRGDADPWRHGLCRGVPGQPLLRGCPGAVDLRGRGRGPCPQGHRPAACRSIASLKRGPGAAPLEDLVILGEAGLVERIRGGQLRRCEDDGPSAGLDRHTAVVRRTHELVFLHMAVLDPGRYGKFVISSVKARRENLHRRAVGLALTASAKPSRSMMSPFIRCIRKSACTTARMPSTSQAFQASAHRSTKSAVESLSSDVTGGSLGMERA